jgi:glycosyltransferase involved in cell wall biosynthesis
LTPPFLVAKELKTFYDAVFVSQTVNEKVAKTLESQNFEVINLNKHFYFKGSLLTLEGWLRTSDFQAPEENSLIVNFSQCFLANNDIYYAQGPITYALKDMYPEMKKTHQFAYRLLKRFLLKKDKNFLQHLKSKTKIFVANSQFCASMYKRLGIKVDKVIYPPIDSKRFKPETSHPANDYVLTYIGKETKYSILNTMANFKIKIKAFGAKNKDVPKKIRKNPNIEILGKVTNVDLVELFSNALYTLFTFTHEPFGYIPVESMACATPVLTHNKQGPRESVINNKTGWLMDNDEEMTEKALRIWKEGYSTKIRKNCLERASEFDQRLIGEKWSRLLELSSYFK